MNATTLLAISVVLQAGAAIAALRLITMTGRRWAWAFIAVAIGLMDVRRALTLYRELTGDNPHPPDLAAESVAVVISALMFIGFLWLGPAIRSIRRADQARSEAMDRFRHLSETTREGVVFHQDGRIVECNSSFARMMGYTREEAIGMEVPRFVAPESRDLVMTRLKQGHDRPYEHLALRKDGSVFDVEACGKTTVIEGRNMRVTTIRDVTERKEVDRSLRDSERAMSTLLANLPGVAYRCLNDRNWTMEFVSEGCKTLTGYEAAEVVGNRMISFGAMQHPVDRERVWIDVQRCLKNKIPFQLTYRITTKEGTEKWVWEQGVGVHSGSGELSAIEGFITDITDRVRAEQALRSAHDELDERVKERTADLEAAKAKLECEIEDRTRIAQALMESERKFRLLCQSAPIGIFLTDATGATIYVNPLLLKVAGLSEAEALGWGWLSCIHPDDRSGVEKEARQAAETGRPFNHEFRLLRRDGETRWVHAQNVLMAGDAGAPVGKVGTVQDVTERKQMELALRDSEQRLQGILDNSPAVIYVKDREGRYLLINRKFEEIFNLEREDVLSLTDDDLFSDDQEAADAFRRNDAAVLETCQPTEFEEVAPHTNGLHTYISLKFPLIGPDGKPYAVCGISTDITDRKRASEAMARAKEEAEAASRAKTVFLANVSHELKTPIMAIMGSAELLRIVREEDSTSPRTDVIIRNARHLLELVERILDLSRIESDRMELHISPCSVLELIEDVRAATTPLPREREVEFAVQFESDVPETIRTDATRVRQALINLVSNALKFTQEGYVHLRVRVDRDNGSLRLVAAVEDSGPGIPLDSLESVFAPFAQLAPRQGTIAHGVGLGLPLARTFARQLGGDVTVQSTPGEGSCFTLVVDAGPADDAEWLPIDAANHQSHRDECRCTADPHITLCGSVLLAEDYRDTRELIQAALVQAGVEVTAVEDGAQALQAAAERPFDLILLDVRMPRMDGVQAVRQLRSKGTPSTIIALTASKEPGEKRRLLDAGFDDLWTKPIRLETLLQEVSAYLAAAPSSEGAPGREPPSSPRDGSRASDFQQLIAAANAEYARALPDKVALVRQYVTEGNLTQARELLHQLAGSGGMHGFMSISDESGRLLKQLTNPDNQEPPDLTRLSQEAESIGRAYGTEASSQPSGTKRTDAG